jgi:hypothetical protein
MCQAQRAVLDARAQEFRGDALLGLEPPVETIDEDIRVNESRDGRDPRVSSRAFLPGQVF